MTQKLLSIVIPTRNREEYCIQSIIDILSYDRKDYELVISDNSDSNILQDFVMELGDDRIIYKHDNKRINFVINSDIAMTMATGKYVCMIGDDDTILPDIFSIAEWAEKNDYPIVSPRNVVVYLWPDKNSSGYVSWPIKDDKKTEKLDCNFQLKVLAKHGLINYYDYLPRIYHGLVKRELLQKVKSVTGHIVGGISPDIYMSITACCVSDFFITIDTPISVAGACPKSYTAVDGKGGNRGRAEDNPQLFKRGDYKLDTRVPIIMTTQTIWAESAMKALVEMGRDDIVSIVRQGYLYAEMIRKNPHNLKMLFRPILKTKLLHNHIVTFVHFLSYYTNWFYRIFCRVVFKNRIKNMKFENVIDIQKAVEIYNNNRAI